MKEKLIPIIKEKFDNTFDLHPGANWDQVEEKLLKDKKLLETLCLMEETGEEVNFVDLPIFSRTVFLDCAKESPKGRRSLCYDKESGIKRNKNDPDSLIMEEVEKMGIILLNKGHYYGSQEILNLI